MPGVVSLYVLGSFLSNGLHLHVELSHAHVDHFEHHHLVLHTHSGLVPSIGACSDIESSETEHRHSVGKIQPATISQTLSKRQRSLESKGVGSEPFVDTSFPQLYLSEPLAVFLSRAESLPEKIFFAVSSGRSPPVA